MIHHKKLLLTLLDASGIQRAHYVIVKGRTVIDEGECALTALPQVEHFCASFLGRSSYFDRIATPTKHARMLPFVARRHLESALAFNEPFRIRYTAKTISTGQQQLSMTAVSEAELVGASFHLPLQIRTCKRLALVESAIAALVAQVTSEATSILWLRGPALLGLIVENGAVLFRLLDTRLNERLIERNIEAGNEQALDKRLERLRASLHAAARRAFPERDIRQHLLLGELAGTSVAIPELASTALTVRLKKRFSHCHPDAPLQWPEVYGLQALPNEVNLLDTSYQQRILAQKVALGIGAFLTITAMAAGATALHQYSEWKNITADLELRRARVEADYALLNARRPSNSQLSALEQRLKIESGSSDFRVDALLAWISGIAPHGATIRSLEIGQTAATPLSTDQKEKLTVHVEWELTGDYPKVEELASQLTQSLVERSRLANSQLEYMPSNAQQKTMQARLKTVLTLLPGRFRE
jgi:hypothetical protein